MARIRHDLFICHATSDKARFVAPLAAKLQERGLKIWYDDISLRPGDSVRRTIEEGILNSRAGLVVLSPRFFAREWPQRELDALVSLEISSKKRVLPIWLDIDQKGVSRFSPLLADRKALVATVNLDALAADIAEHVPNSHAPDAEIKNEIERRLTHDSALIRQITSVSLLNFHRLLAVWDAHERILDDYPGGFADEEELGQRLDECRTRTIKFLKMPTGVYVERTDPLASRDIIWIERHIRKWCAGKLSSQESIDLLVYLDEAIDTDYNYILFDIPHWRVSGIQMVRLREAVSRIGSRRLRNAEQLLSSEDLLLRSFESLTKGRLGD